MNLKIDCYIKMWFLVKICVCGLRVRVFFFFCGGLGLNTGPYIYYALFLPTELSIQGIKWEYIKVNNCLWFI